MTRIMAAEFEEFIAAAPADWHMLQPAWEDLPPLPETEAVGEPAPAAASP
jgi:lauroyl/myristoyl acyltransferase